MDSHRLVVVAFAALVVLAGCASPAGDTGSPVSDGATNDATATPATTDADSPPSSPAAPGGTLEVHFINVGQSSATLVVGPDGETMLVDTGDFTDDGEEVLAYLDRVGVDRIDHLVTTHNDADHIGGHAAVIDHYETDGEGVGAIYDPGIAASTATYGRYLDAVEEHDVPLYEVRADDVLPFDGAEVRVLAPPEDYLANDERNENSVVLHVAFGEARFLLTGDGEDAAEEYLVETYGSELRASVLTAGHHGSRTSTSAGLLDATGPQVVVISSAYDSRFGHPHQETLDKLAARELPTYWTGTHGDVVVRTDGERLTVATQRDAPTDPSRLRDAPAVEPGTTDPVETRVTLDVTTGSASDSPVTAVATDGGSETDGSTSGATDSLALVDVHADADGDDRDNLGDEYVVFENVGDGPLDLSGWTVSDEAGATYTVPDGVTLAAGERLTLRTGSGTDTETELHWGRESPVWNNDGDVVTVATAAGDVVIQEAY
ncbi:competence protein ComEC [Halogranum gelatinilyticum]|uniref:Competence protein ComEC n=1 Tax=Halogranum gelatinilyticum TaxID=660521 RepID=A0A1G9VMU7_9EURY|nr:lamin tail domain-containing protein [Halogranum gelatinilyticum]SDM73351.1 competence protein ComEC [Halogranum gelatinilyticum]